MGHASNLAGSMNSATQHLYTLISNISTVIHLILALVGTAVAWIGWRRQRKLGWLFLVAWGGCSALSVLMHFLLVFAESWLRSNFSSLDPVLLMIGANAATYLGLSIILLAGLSCLVFSKDATTSQQSGDGIK